MGEFGGPIGHNIVETVKSGNIIVTIWEKKVEDTKVYYDISISRQYFYEGDEPKYSSKIQQRDYDDLLFAIIEARMIIKEKVFALRENNRS